MRGLAVGVLLACAAAACAAADEEEGKKIFTGAVTAPACALCHTLKQAGAEGAIGPSLDELKPDAARVARAVKGGIGVMPAFPQLSDAQVQAVAKYVESVAGK
jgi:sulfite dehydrogenase